MVNIVSGGASNSPNSIGDEQVELDKPSWVAKWSLEPSYSRVTVYNASTLLFQQVSSDLDERIIDELTLRKTLFRSY